MSCMRSGPITSNGYLNFLRDFRKQCCGMSAVQTVIEGAKAWRNLSCEEKAKYRRMGCGVKNVSKRGCKGRARRAVGSKKKCAPKRKKRACKPKRRSTFKKVKRCSGNSRRSKTSGKQKCSKPGPLTNNAYLNFLRYFRKCNCNLSPRDILRLGAKKWCSMSDEEKLKFRIQACQMTKSCYKKKSKICREAAQRKREANRKNKRKCKKSS